MPEVCWVPLKWVLLLGDFSCGRVTVTDPVPWSEGLGCKSRCWSLFKLLQRVLQKHCSFPHPPKYAPSQSLGSRLAGGGGFPFLSCPAALFTQGS